MSKSFMKVLKSTGPNMESCRTPLVTGRQSDITPFSIQPGTHTFHDVLIQLFAGPFLQMDTEKDSIKTLTEIKKNYINWLPLIC